MKGREIMAGSPLGAKKLDEAIVTLPAPSDSSLTTRRRVRATVPHVSMKFFGIQTQNNETKHPQADTSKLSQIKIFFL